MALLKTKIAPGIATHPLPRDLKKALQADAASLTLWNSLTPLGRNEFICWVVSAKLIETRARRVERTLGEMSEGKRRPCCWPGCMHRAKTGHA